MAYYKLEPWADLILEAYFLYHRPVREIARYFRSSPDAVETVFRRHQVSPHSPWATHQKKRAHQLAACRKLGLPVEEARDNRYHKKSDCDARDKSIVATYLSGRSMSVVGLFHGCGAMYVRKVLIENGVPRRPRGRPRTH